MLEVSSLEAGYGDTVILRDVSVDLEDGEIVAVVGPNGAGKTTLMRCLIGELTPFAGTISYEGTDITDLPTHERIADGISLVPEGRHLFREMTVEENLTLGTYVARERKEERLDRVFDLFPRLAERRDQQAGTLSGGEAQMLTIGRSLMADPQVLLLDEPSLGLAPKLVPEVFDKIREINDGGVSVVLVEQIVNKSLELADQGYLLENGEIVLEGPADDLADEQRVIEQYLGGET